MPADLLLFALIAAGLIFWLRSILGTRDENDEKPKRPNLFSDEDGLLSSNSKKENNVVALNPSTQGKHSLPAHVRIDNKTTENKIDDITIEHPKFDVGHFAEGAEGAFSMVVESFAEGDVETLEGLLAPEVFKAFKGAIEERNKRGETVDTKIHGVEKMDITDVMIKENHIFITVRFAARETCVIKDKAGDIISGDPDKTTVMIDVWVFGRELNFDGPEWYLYETRDDEAEDHKTPLPEGGSDKEKK